MDFKDIGDTLTVGEWNGLVSLLQYNMVLSESFKMQSLVEGEYANYYFDFDGCTVIDNGLLVTNETLLNDKRIRLVNPVFEFGVYELHLKLMRISDYNLYTDLQRNNISFEEIVVRLDKDNDEHLLDLSGYDESYVLLLDVNCFIRQELPLIYEVGGGNLFYDDCSSDNTSQYDALVRLGATSNLATLTYISSENAYMINNTSTRDAFMGYAIPDLQGEDNIRITVKTKILTNNAYNQLLVGCADNIAQSSSTGTFDMFRIRGDNKSDYLHNRGNEVTGSSSATSVYNQYVYIVFEKQGTSITGNVYDENMALLRTYTYTSANSYSNPYFFILVNTNRTADVKYIQLIQAEAI